MMMNQTARSSRMRAFKALEALLTGTSAIKLKDVDLGLVGEGGEVDIVAHIEVLGHSRTLACQLAPDAEPQNVTKALGNLHRCATQLPGDVTPVVVMPCLSQEARELCHESNAGFLDLHGNGCLAFGEVFISMRSSPCRTVHQSSHAPVESTKTNKSRNPRAGFPPAHADLPSHGLRTGRRA